MLSAMNVLLLLPLFKAIPFAALIPIRAMERSEEHTSELQSQSNLVCRLLLEKKKHQVHLLSPSLHNSLLSPSASAALQTGRHYAAFPRLLVTILCSLHVRTHYHTSLISYQLN